MLSLAAVAALPGRIGRLADNRRGHRPRRGVALAAFSSPRQVCYLLLGVLQDFAIWGGEHSPPCLQAPQFCLPAQARARNFAPRLAKPHSYPHTDSLSRRPCCAWTHPVVSTAADTSSRLSRRPTAPPFVLSSLQVSTSN